MRLRELRITYHPVAGAPPGPRPRLSTPAAPAWPTPQPLSSLTTTRAETLSHRRRIFTLRLTVIKSVALPRPDSREMRRRVAGKARGDEMSFRKKCGTGQPLVIDRK